MTGHRSAHQDVVLVREDLDNLQALYLHTVTTHPACHANSLHDTGCIGRVTQGTRSTLTVMLTVRLLAHTMKAMTLNHTLKTLTFRSADDFDFLTFFEDVYSNGFT